MNTFITRLEQRINKIGAPLCVGLDPRPEEMTGAERYLLASEPEAALIAHGERLLAATRHQAAAYKPNIAFYEAHGAAGLRALERLVPRLSEVAPVILDAKRGDIGSTALAYVEAVKRLGAEAVTLSPYLGEDAVAPFLEAGLFVFLLARTSNPSAVLQDDGLVPIWSRVVTASQGWASALAHPGALGFVVGATAPDVLAEVRRLAPDRWILAPGVGAQGGEVEVVMKAAGSRVLMPVSRAISGAPDPEAAAAAFVTSMSAPSHASHDVASTGSSSMTERHRALVDGLFDRGCVRFGEFRLKSGIMSPIYLDLRRLVAFPDLLTLAARAYAEVMATLDFDQIAALPYAAMPLGTAVSLLTGKPMLYPRREAKDYGTQAVIEGVFEPGQKALVLDDVATRGDSKVEAFARLEGAGLVVNDVLVLIDREGGARELMAQHGKSMHAVFGLRELVRCWVASGRIDADQAGAVERFLIESA